MATAPPVGPAGGTPQQPAQSIDTGALAASLASLTRSLSGVNRDVGSIVASLAKHSRSLDDTINERGKQEKARTKEEEKQHQDIIKSRLKRLQEEQKQQDIALNAARQKSHLERYKTSLEKASATALAKALNDKKQLAEKTKKELKQKNDEIQKIEMNLLKASTKTKQAEQKKLEAALAEYDRLQETLANTTDKLILIENEKERELASTKNLTKAKDALKQKALDLVSGFSLAVAATKLWETAVRQSATGEINTLGQGIRSMFRQTMSGVGDEQYQAFIQQTRTQKLMVGEDGQQDILAAGTNRFFQSTGSRNEAAQITAELVPSLMAAGVASKDMAGMMDPLGDGFARLAIVTGKSTQELAKMTSELLLDNDIRVINRGLSQQEQKANILRMSQTMEQLTIDGYSIDQARDRLRLEAQQRLGGTMSSRAKDIAQLENAINMQINQETDPERRAKLIENRNTMRENRQLALYGRQGDPATIKALEAYQQAANDSATRIQEAAGSQAGTTGFLAGSRTPYEYMKGALDSGMFAGNQVRAGEELDPAAKAIVEAQAKQGELFDGAIGGLTSVIQSLNNAIMGPLGFSIAALGASVFMLARSVRLGGALGKAGGLLEGVGKSGKGLLGKIGGLGGSLMSTVPTGAAAATAAKAPLGAMLTGTAGLGKAAALGTAGLGIGAAGAAGYGIGTLANMGINKTISAVTGVEGNTLGSVLYDWFNDDPMAKMDAADAAKRPSIVPPGAPGQVDTPTATAPTQVIREIEEKKAAADALNPPPAPKEMQMMVDILSTIAQTLKSDSETMQEFYARLVSAVGGTSSSRLKDAIFGQSRLARPG
jgi:hypothetical protein